MWLGVSGGGPQRREPGGLRISSESNLPTELSPASDDTPAVSIRRAAGGVRRQILLTSEDGHLFAIANTEKTR